MEDKQATVVGCGLNGALAAHLLMKSGYSVTIVEATYPLGNMNSDTTLTYDGTGPEEPSWSHATADEWVAWSMDSPLHAALAPIGQPMQHRAFRESGDGWEAEWDSAPVGDMVRTTPEDAKLLHAWLHADESLAATASRLEQPVTAAWQLALAAHGHTVLSRLSRAEKLRCGDFMRVPRPDDACAAYGEPSGHPPCSLRYAARSAVIRQLIAGATLLTGRSVVRVTDGEVLHTATPAEIQDKEPGTETMVTLAAQEGQARLAGPSVLALPGYVAWYVTRKDSTALLRDPAIRPDPAMTSMGILSSSTPELLAHVVTVKRFELSYKWASMLVDMHDVVVTPFRFSIEVAGTHYWLESHPTSAQDVLITVPNTRLPLCLLSPAAIETRRDAFRAYLARKSAGMSRSAIASATLDNERLSRFALVYGRRRVIPKSHRWHDLSSIERWAAGQWRACMPHAVWTATMSDRSLQRRLEHVEVAVAHLLAET